MKFQLTNIQKQKISKLIGYDTVILIKKQLNPNSLFFKVIFPKALPERINYISCSTENYPKYFGEEPKLKRQLIQGFNNQWEAYFNRPYFLREYALLIRDCFIEPSYGWAYFIKQTRIHLIFDSIAFNGWNESNYPNGISLLIQHFKKNKFKLFDKLISLNFIKGGESNYWHFMMDMLGQLVLVEQLGLNDVPILIPKELLGKPYFQYVVQMSPKLRKKIWVERSEVVFASELYCFQSMPLKYGNTQKIIDLLELPTGSQSANRKIFLTRSSNLIRSIRNIKAVEAVMKELDIEIIDCDKLTSLEQQSLFQETALIIGIHGAGLTNILYRNCKKLHLIEIFPKNYIQYFYYYLCKDLKFEYSYIVGTNYHSDFTFDINVAELQKIVAEQFV